jgi:hypothetical protein
MASESANMDSLFTIKANTDWRIMKPKKEKKATFNTYSFVGLSSSVSNGG